MWYHLVWYHVAQGSRWSLSPEFKLQWQKSFKSLLAGASISFKFNLKSKNCHCIVAVDSDSNLPVARVQNAVTSKSQSHAQAWTWIHLWTVMSLSLTNHNPVITNSSMTLWVWQPESLRLAQWWKQGLHDRVELMSKMLPVKHTKHCVLETIFRTAACKMMHCWIQNITWEAQPIVQGSIWSLANECLLWALHKCSTVVHSDYYNVEQVCRLLLPLRWPSWATGSVWLPKILNHHASKSQSNKKGSFCALHSSKNCLIAHTTPELESQVTFISFLKHKDNYLCACWNVETISSNKN